MRPQGTERPVQEAYGGESYCFGCGAANPDGLQLRSYRIKGGLMARITLANKHLCFPGIVSGGIITTLFDCHGELCRMFRMRHAVLLSRLMHFCAIVLCTSPGPTPHERPVPQHGKCILQGTGQQPSR